MSPRPRGHHVRKVCRCGWRKWKDCAHPWHFTYKPRVGGLRYRFSLDAEFGGHIVTKGEAELKAADIRAKIDANKFERTADRRRREEREQREAAERAERERLAADTASPATVSAWADAVSANSPDQTAGVTFDAFVKSYITRAAKATGKTTWKDDEYLLGSVADHRTADGRRLGELAMTAITEDELEAFHSAQREAGRAASTLNHQVQVIKAAFRWAARKSYVARSPVSDGSSLKRSKIAKRQRRLYEAEEEALLGVAAPRLYWIIVGALETGMRLGELLALTWRDLDRKQRVLTVRAENAKDDETRLLPISKRLDDVLEMAKSDQAGREFPADAFVFGNELGDRVGSIKKAWETAVLKAPGVNPHWVRGKLSADCRTQLRRIDLHFHDLRREAASRWHEGGFSLHEVRDLLGHSNVSQTDTYLGAKLAGLRTKMDRFDALRGNPWQTPPPIEHRPHCHAEGEDQRKDQLH